jgi:hypothetical protein
VTACGTRHLQLGAALVAELGALTVLVLALRALQGSPLVR